MKCKQCGREIPEAAIFCCWCGVKQLRERRKKDAIKVPKPRKLRPVGVCGDMPNIILDAAASVIPFKLYAVFAGHCGKGVISGGEVLPVLYKLRCQVLALCNQLSGAAVIVPDFIVVVAGFRALQIAPYPYSRFPAGAAVAGEQLVFIAHLFTS